jgi:hypothetical protein
MSCSEGIGMPHRILATRLDPQEGYFCGRLVRSDLSTPASSTPIRSHSQMHSRCDLDHAFPVSLLIRRRSTVSRARTGVWGM